MSAQAWVTLVVGLAATGGGLAAWHQKNIADRRSEWWRRVTWALERTFSADDAEATLGWNLLKTLIQSKLATRGDRDVIQAIAEHAAIDDDPEGGPPDVDVQQRQPSSEPEAPS